MQSYWGVDHGIEISKQDQSEPVDKPVQRLAPKRFKRTGSIAQERSGGRTDHMIDGRGRKRGWRPDEDKR